MNVEKSATSMGRPREFDAEEALDRAMHLFWRKGYLGTSLSDLTEALGINRPSLYAAFGNKEALFRKVLERYAQGPAHYLCDALNETTARAVAERMMIGAVELATGYRNACGCLWVNGLLSCGDAADPLRKEVASHRHQGQAALLKRLKRAVAEGDLPADADPVALARFVGTVTLGIAVQAATGSTRAELMRVVKLAMRAWPA